MTWTDADRAYAAGFFDGEGSIMVGKSYRNYGRGTYYGAWVHVGGCDRESIEWFNQEFPGHFSVRTYRNEHCRDLYRWHLYRKRAAAFLREIEPFLRLKRPQAGLALELDSLCYLGQQRLDDETYSRMVKIHAEMAKLNQRGR